MAQIVTVCELNPECNPKYDLTRRVYSRGGICPTIPAWSGYIPKILIEGVDEKTGKNGNTAEI